MNGVGGGKGGGEGEVGGGEMGRLDYEMGYFRVLIGMTIGICILLLFLSGGESGSFSNFFFLFLTVCRVTL